MLKILVVDDNEENLYLLQALLDSNGFQTVFTNNGADALEMLEKDIPGLIISDILMPVMDGFTFCRKCKADERLKHIPFFFYTATYTDIKDETFALGLGADRFILKPQEPDVFIQIINDFFDEFNKTIYQEKDVNQFSEEIVLKEYNEVLIRKIEAKMLQAEKAEKELRKYAEELENEIRERIKKEECLIASENYNRLLFNSSPNGLVLCSMDGYLIDVNPTFSKMIGRTIEETLKLNNSDITPEKYANQDVEQLKKLKETGHYGTYEKEYIHKDGHFVPVLLKGLILERDGEPFLLSTVEDISDRKEAELALRKSQQLFQTLAQFSPVGIFRTTPEGFTTYVNPKWSELSGLPFEKALGNNWLDAVHPEDRAKIIAKWNSDTSTKDFSSAEYRFLREDGTIIWVIGNAVPEWNNNNINGYIGTITDITKIKQFEMDLLQAKNKAEESDRLKSAFLKNISHEIRTPMNGILGFAELLKEPGLSGTEQQDFIRIIEKSGERMLNIINEIVEISKLESGQIDILVSNTNLYKLFQSTCNDHKTFAEQKGLKLSIIGTLPETETFIMTDPEKIRKILTNLIMNAIKYTFNGSIEVGCEKTDSCFKFYVKDTGIGIPKDRQEAIFDRFVQADIDDKYAFQGAGLGLSISKAYVEMLGGKIWVESEVGIGSDFKFTVPFSKDE